ncbi:unnamed protein product [Dovyalis caffra]|uniref:Uncharacterized protein n=1 Tax=Dovyalis caffra TaxID=77055 RepID=A0AAV1QVU5_9ROSI|nr:unnamed protein product [Dovyalis caffra]
MWMNLATKLKGKSKVDEAKKMESESERSAGSAKVTFVLKLLSDIRLCMCMQLESYRDETWNCVLGGDLFKRIFTGMDLMNGETNCPKKLLAPCGVVDPVKGGGE